MEEETGGGIDRRKDRQTEGQTEGGTDRLRDEQMEGLTQGQTGVRTGGQTEWRGRRIEGKLDSLTREY